MRAARAGDDAELNLGLAELCRVRRHAHVARQRQFAPAAQGVAGNGGDSHAGDAGHGVERLAEVAADARRLLGAAELRDVGAGGEDPVASRDDDGAGRVGGEAPGRLGDLAQHSDGKGVSGRAIESQHRDAVVAPIDIHKLSHRT